jgi:hypothetical protein
MTTRDSSTLRFLVDPFDFLSIWLGFDSLDMEEVTGPFLVLAFGGIKGA